jgi:hypothetical protein
VKPDSPQALARMLNTFLGYEKGAWEGIVLDLSEIPAPRAYGLLQALAPPSETVAVKSAR